MTVCRRDRPVRSASGWRQQPRCLGGAQWILDVAQVADDRDDDGARAQMTRLRRWAAPTDGLHEGANAGASAPRDGPEGVIRVILMDPRPEVRPTSGASVGQLVAQLREARHRTQRLTEDLASNELMGPYLPIVNPVLWEIGHIAWFHEYWTLRHAAQRGLLIERGDSLWDSSNEAHVTRWKLDLPDRAGTFGYMADVLRHQEELLARSIDDTARYFYDLSIRHEDMHVEALTYMRQTLAFAPPDGMGRAARPVVGALPGVVGWTLAPRINGERRLRVRQREVGARDISCAVRITRAAVTNAEFEAFVEAGGYRTRAHPRTVDSMGPRTAGAWGDAADGTDNNVDGAHHAGRKPWQPSDLQLDDAVESVVVGRARREVNVDARPCAGCRRWRGSCR